MESEGKRAGVGEGEREGGGLWGGRGERKEKDPPSLPPPGVTCSASLACSNSSMLSACHMSESASSIILSSARESVASTMSPSWSSAHISRMIGTIQTLFQTVSSGGVWVSSGHRCPPQTAPPPKNSQISFKFSM